MLQFNLTTVFGYFVLLTLHFELAESHCYYITPTSNVTCPNENTTQCLTLSEYAQQSLETAPAANSNITLTFAPGNHQLDSDLWVFNVTSLILQGAHLNNSSLPVATITCFDSGFIFENISKVSISSLQFNGCKENTVRVVTQFKLEGCKFHTGNGIELEKVVTATIVRSLFASLLGRKTKSNLKVPGLTKIVGGAITIKNSIVMINECQFERNVACPLTISSADACINDINAIQKINKLGGSIVTLHSILLIIESQFDQNMALIGGSIYSWDSDVEINMSNFTNNTAVFEASAIDADAGTNLLIHGSIFVNNTTAAGGGALCLVNSSAAVIEKCHFEGNMADIGGSICAYSPDNTIAINECQFEENAASDIGGAIHIENGNVEINMSIFVNNKATDSGALSSLNNVSVVINKCQFEGNVAHSICGSIGVANTSKNIEINMSNFINNAAFNSDSIRGGGGAICTNAVKNINMYDNTFLNNTAGYIGGALCVRYSTIVIDKCKFEGNMAVVSAGSVISFDSDVIIKMSNFNNNSADECGVLAIGTDTMSVYDSVFVNNTATVRYGGAMCTYYAIVVVDSCQFEGNVAATAGVIYSDNSKIEINMSNVIKNSASIQGGAIIADFGSNITTYHSTFVNNIAYGNHGQGGVILARKGSNIAIHDSIFINNRAVRRSMGGVISASSSIVLISKCQFNRNAAYTGGLIFSRDSDIEINMSSFNNNAAHSDGGTIVADNTGTNITISESTFENSSASNGGVIHTSSGTITIKQSIFSNSRANNRGGAIAADNTGTNITISESTFKNSSASNGGVIHVSSSTITIKQSIFTNNRANNRGGAIDASSAHVTNFITTVVIKECQFDENMAAQGGLIFLENSHVEINMSNFTNSAVEGDGGVIAASSSTMLIHNGMFMNSTAGFGGVIYIDNGSVFIYDSAFINSTANKYTSSILALHNLQEGPVALTCFQGDIPITDKVITSTDQISNGLGGAIMAANSKIHAYGDTTIANNMAALSGGGIYAYQSELNFQGIAKIVENTATEKGGGIYAVNTSVKLTGGTLQFTKNKAERGGGVYLELNAKLNVIKSEKECSENNVPDCTNTSETTRLGLQFINNTAHYGGALYISDHTNTRTCAGDKDQSTASECFFQGLGLHSVNNEALNIRNTHFTGNSATKSGWSIFGGLLDRCKVSPNAEVFNKYQNLSPSSLNATTYLTEITDLTAHDIQTEISSKPVRVCICKDGLPDCNYSLPTYQVMKGRTFQVSLTVVDQVQNPVPAEVTAVLALRDGRLGVGQDIQNTTLVCTYLNYTIFSLHNSERLTLYAKGPCTDIGISKLQINVEYLSCNCPIGFVIDVEQSQTDCVCVCDPRIYPSHIASCSIDNESVQRKDNKWINYINSSNQDSYLIHPHCPFDYCRPLDEVVWINLNVSNGADVQCSFNRSGKLCGACEDGLSLSVGSSRCMPCSNNWLTLLIVFAVVGIALVAFILKWNLTVAVGTTNGLIFYANIIAANHAIFLSFDKPNVLTIFISWLNLDFGFETCFYNGMDGYAQTWLQLAFPLYIISLVVAIIVISDYSSKFAALFTKGNDPIATLATLILLSYAKLIRTIIASLSFTTIEYTDGSHELVWLTDANVPYLRGKHIPLFLTAIVIVIVGLTYTILLFGWQWLVHPKIKPLAWITKNGKVFIFMDTYHNPYNKDHRYWIGLLLFVRTILFIISAVNVLGDPHINLLGINSAVVILFFIQIFPGHKITKRKPIFAIENISYLNLICFTSATYYITADRESQSVVAYMSTTIAFITFLAVLIYHTCMFALNKQYEKVKSLFKSLHRDSHTPANQTPPDTTNRDTLVEAVGVTIVDHPEIHDTLSDDYEQSKTESDDETETSNERDTSADSKETLDYRVHTDIPSGWSQVVTRPVEDAHNLACNVKFIDTEIPTPVSRNVETIEMSTLSTVVICYESEEDDCKMGK